MHLYWHWCPLLQLSSLWSYLQFIVKFDWWIWNSFLKLNWANPVRWCWLQLFMTCLLPFHQSGPFLSSFTSPFFARKPVQRWKTWIWKVEKWKNETWKVENMDSHCEFVLNEYYRVVFTISSKCKSYLCKALQRTCHEPIQ